MKFRAKEGDELYYRFKGVPSVGMVDKVTVVGFRCYGIECKSEDYLYRGIPFCCGLFYAVGYDSAGRYIFTKKKSHYFWATVCEWIRLNLPAWVDKKIFKI